MSGLLVSQASQVRDKTKCPSNPTFLRTEIEHSSWEPVRLPVFLTQEVRTRLQCIPLSLLAVGVFFRRDHRLELDSETQKLAPVAHRPRRSATPIYSLRA
ncbi:unnamed protein product [Ectocarpus fasciculatus]